MAVDASRNYGLNAVTLDGLMSLRACTLAPSFKVGTNSPSAMRFVVQESSSVERVLCKVGSVILLERVWQLRGDLPPCALRYKI